VADGAYQADAWRQWRLPPCDILVHAGEVDLNPMASNEKLMTNYVGGAVMLTGSCMPVPICERAQEPWQTETGGQMIAPLPGATALVPGSCTLPLPGIVAAVVDETGQALPNGSGGILAMKRPWPSMTRTIWGDPDRFKQSYFPAELGGDVYLAGDDAIRDQDSGYFTITGRIDDVLNVSGHRMRTMEIESALVAHPLVAEAAVVGRADEVTGEAICAFVVLKRECPSGEEARQLAADLRKWVDNTLGEDHEATAAFPR
jgi:acetyl-CoA synthetase